VPRLPKPKSARNSVQSLPLDTSLLKPGMRLAVALSGGADSVALLRALVERRQELGLVLHAAHLHHGLRGAEADEDLEFCRELAAKLEVPFHEARVDAAAEARADAKSGKPVETIEEAGRRLRYAWFRQLLSKSPPHAGLLDAIVTAHTLDDQAETVLAKFLRGAWTEGLAGISPVLEFPGRCSAGLQTGCRVGLRARTHPLPAWTPPVQPDWRLHPCDGRILRPLLAVTRAEIEAYLRGLGQDWREDSSNRHLTFTRNRIRHELLPLLEGWNPRLREHLAQMAQLARDEEAWWQAELARLAPQMILPGRPARGGGRAAGLDSGLAIEVPRLAALAPALQRRLLRHAAQQLGVALDFAATEAVRSLALGGRAGQRLALPQGLQAERTARELRFSLVPDDVAKGKDGAAKGAIGNGQERQYSGPIPGVLDAPAFGVRLRIERVPTKVTEHGQSGHNVAPQTATLRNWRPGDRVRLRYSGGLRKVKEVLERKHVTGTERAIWPVLEAGGQIVWMRGVELEPVPGLTIAAEEFAAESPLAPSQNRPKAE
jgi:tRNA(Ile)-lysidine synthase